MKVALFSSGSGSRGGGEIYLSLLAEGLHILGHEVHAVVPCCTPMDELAESLKPFARVDRIDIRPTYERPMRNIAAMMDRAQQATIAARIEDIAPDIVHLNQQVTEDALDFLAAARRTGRPWVSTLHMGHSARALGAKFGSLRDAVTGAAIRRPGGDFITISQASGEQLTARFGKPWARERLHIIYNGVRVPDPETLARTRRDARAEWGVAPDELVFGMVGRIAEQKNPLGFVDYVAPLLREGLRVRLVWIGDGDMRAELEAHARKVAPGARLHIDGWRDDANQRMAGLDVFVLPSKFEGLPLALQEAMHAGLAIISISTDGTPEAVRHDETGLLCATPAEWADAMSRIARDPALRARLSATARHYARERYSQMAMSRATERVYLKLLEKKTRNAA